jgi:hypothetical protein
MNKSNNIPELAGVATYSSAARIGYSVEENVERLLRLHWTERRLMEIMHAHLPSTALWEVKCAMALHQWYAAEHADWLRTRITEMRHPAPPLDVSPDDALDTFLGEVLRARNTDELLVGIYALTLPALRDAYYRHIERTNPLVDHPTVRFMRIALAEVSEAVQWGESALAAMPDASATAEWREHLTAFLDAAHGITGEGDIDIREGDSRRGTSIRAMEAPLPSPRSAEPFAPDFTPARDDRFRGRYNFEFTPQLVYNAENVPADERNLALLCKRTLEMDVPEVMASFLFERKDQPWEFYLDYSRQLWDEARHAMMGTVAFEAKGVDWTRQIPLNVGFSMRLNLHASPRDRQILLYAIEQSLMPAETGKRFEYETAVEAGDELSAHFHDYDWADEVLHAQIGRRALKREGISREEAIKRGEEIHDRTWKALEQYRAREPQTDWWPDFVKTVLGRASAFSATDSKGAPAILGGRQTLGGSG